MLAEIASAIMFYTRLPMPEGMPHSDEILNRSRTWFPLVGLIVGGIAAWIFAAAQLLWPSSVAFALSMAATVLVTGAFHEDGFADTCDGLGGGWTVEQKLTIMKDSRLGTYGAVGLAFMLGLKFVALAALTDLRVGSVAALMVMTHAVSRQFASTVIETADYVADIDVSKVRPIANRRLSASRQLVAWLIAGTGAVPVALLAPRALIAIVVGAIVSWLFRGFCVRSIGGYTGDTLGATQQLSELTMLLAAVALLV